MSEKNYWIIIPPPIVGDKNLPSGAKLLFGRIFALISRKGYCYASNKFLGKDIGLTKKTVSKYLSKLAKVGYLRIELIRGENNQVKERRIYPYPIIIGYLSTHNRIPIRLKSEKSKDKEIKRREYIYDEGLKSLKETMENLGLLKRNYV